jgi:site-specific DNA-methyltransferase (adenine-specific)
MTTPANGLLARNSTPARIPQELVWLEQARELLSQCASVDKVKQIRDRAEAIRLYQKQQTDSQRAQNAAAVVKIRAERRLGELLEEPTRRKRGRPPKKPSTLKELPRLSDLGISETMSHRCQAIAAIPEKEFEEVIQEKVQKNQELTSREMIQRGRIAKRLDDKRAAIHSKPSPTMPDPTWEVRQGSCLDVLGDVEPGSVRLVFADPPYNIGVEYGEHHSDRMPADQYEEWSRHWLSLCSSLLTWDGSLLLLINWEWAHDLVVVGRDIGLHYQQTLVWFESFGVNCTRKYNRCSRALIWFTRHRESYVWNPDAVNRLSDRQRKYNDKRANPNGKTWDDVWGIEPPIPRLTATCKERLPDIPTQLPLDLLRPVIGCHSDENDLVVDPFSGSGTTGCVCRELGRRFIGIELGPEVAELSRKRILSHESCRARGN